MDPLANAYLKIVNESVAELQNSGVVKTDLKIGSAFGHDEKNAKTFQKKSGPEDSEGAEDVEDPKEAEAHLTAGKQNDGTPKKLDNSSRNPFDVLFNKIISEEGIMDFSTDTENPEDSSFEPTEGEETDEFGEEEESEEGGDEVTFTLDRETAEKLHDVLMSVLGGEGEEHESEESEGEEEAEHEFGGSEEGEEEEESSQGGALPFGEATDLKELSSEKGKKLIGKKNVVQGAVPVTKKKAVTPATGRGFDGKLKAHSTSGAVSKLQSKKQDVGGVTVGKTIFDNE